MADANMFGFKMVDETNVFHPDALMGAFVTVKDGRSRPMQPSDVIGPLRAVTLDEPVPHEVRRAFYFARNSMCYAYWYYPLFTLGSQQVLRVADLATTFAGTKAGLRPHSTFGPRICQLRRAGVIDAARFDNWQHLVKLRNLATHPEWQETWGIGQAVGVVREVADEVTRLDWR